MNRTLLFLLSIVIGSLATSPQAVAIGAGTARVLDQSRQEAHDWIALHDRQVEALISQSVQEHFKVGIRDFKMSVGFFGAVYASYSIGPSVIECKVYRSEDRGLIEASLDQCSVKTASLAIPKKPLK